VSDLRRVPLHIVIGDQTERPDLTRAVTGGAARPHDGCDVSGESDTRLSRDRRRKDQPRAHDAANTRAREPMVLRAFVTSWRPPRRGGGLHTCASIPTLHRKPVPPAVGIFLTARGVRLAPLWQMRASPFFSVLLGDPRGYDEGARRIAGGAW